MSLKIKGKIIRILPEQKGTSQRGEWKKQDFVLETVEDQFPRKICFTLFNDKTSSLSALVPGNEVEVWFNIESREYNEKWYHNINAYRIDHLTQNNAGDAPPAISEVEFPLAEATGDGEDLPF